MKTSKSPKYHIWKFNSNRWNVIIVKCVLYCRNVVIKRYRDKDLRIKTVCKMYMNTLFVVLCNNDKNE